VGLQRASRSRHSRYFCGFRDRVSGPGIESDNLRVARGSRAARSWRRSKSLMSRL